MTPWTHLVSKLAITAWHIDWVAINKGQQYISKKMYRSIVIDNNVNTCSGDDIIEICQIYKECSEISEIGSTVYVTESI